MKFHVDLETTLRKSFSKRTYIIDSLPLRHDRTTLNPSTIDVMVDSPS